ncbi:hypothetical protein HDU93_007075, partial [Gonapodya sp. JEL0774]
MASGACQMTSNSAKLVQEIQYADLISAVAGVPPKFPALLPGFLECLHRFLTTPSGLECYRKAGQKHDMRVTNEEKTITFIVSVRRVAKLVEEHAWELSSQDIVDTASNSNTHSEADDVKRETTASLKTSGQPRSSSTALNIVTGVVRETFNAAKEQLWAMLPGKLTSSSVSPDEATPLTHWFTPGEALHKQDRKLTRELYVLLDEATVLYQIIVRQILGEDMELVNNIRKTDILEHRETDLTILDDIFKLDVLPILNIMHRHEVSKALFKKTWKSEDTNGEIRQAAYLTGANGARGDSFAAVKTFRNRWHAHGPRMIVETNGMQSVFFGSAIASSLEPFNFDLFYNLSNDDVNRCEDIRLKVETMASAMAEDLRECYELASKRQSSLRFPFIAARNELDHLIRSETTDARSKIYYKLFPTYHTQPPQPVTNTSETVQTHQEMKIAVAGQELAMAMGPELGIPSVLLGQRSLQESVDKLTATQSEQSEKITKIERRIREDRQPKRERGKRTASEAVDDLDEAKITILVKGPTMRAEMKDELCVDIAA